MPRRFVIHTSQDGQSPNQVDNDLDIGYRYADTFLEKTGGNGGNPLTAAEWTYIELLANGKSKWKLTGTQLDEILKSYGYAAYDGVTWQIPHTLLGMSDTDFQTMGEINTGVDGPDGVSIYSLTLRYVCSVAGVTIQASSYVDDPTGEGPGLMRRWITYSEAGSTAGEEKLTGIKWNYGTDDTQFWCRMYVRASVGAITDMRIEVAGDRWNGRIKPIQVMAANTGRRTLGTYFDYYIDFSLDGVGKAPIVVPSSKELVAGYNPFFDTAPFRNPGKKTIDIKVYVTNDTDASTNTYILEVLGKATA